MLIISCCAISTVLIAQCLCVAQAQSLLKHSAYSTVIMCSTVLIEQVVQHGAYGTVLQDNLRCFGVNYDMSRITRFLCYFLSLKLASVLSYYAFPSLSQPNLTEVFYTELIWVRNEIGLVPVISEALCIPT